VEGQKDREEHPRHRMGYLPNDWGKGKEKNQEQPRAEADDTVERAENLGWYLV